MDFKAPCVIAALGDEDEELYPLTLSRPKPLLSMCGRSVLDRAFETLARQGCTEFIVTCKNPESMLYLKEYFKGGEGFLRRRGSRAGAGFRYQPYSEGGRMRAVKLCMERYDIRGNVLVIGDSSIMNIDLRGLVGYHERRNAMLTVCLREPSARRAVSGDGAAVLDRDGRIIRIDGRLHDPSAEGEHVKPTNNSTYLLSPKIRDVIGETEVEGGIWSIIPYLLDTGYPVYGYRCRGHCSDVGTPGGFLETSLQMVRGEIGRFELDPWQTRLPVEGDAGDNKRHIHPTSLQKLGDRLEEVSIGDYTYIGADCEFGDGVAIESSCIGDGCVIGEGSTLRNSVVMDFVNIGRRVRLEGCIVGRFATIEDGSVIDSTLVSDASGEGLDTTPVVGQGVTILSGSIIGPGKRVAQIQESHRILSTEKFAELGYDDRNIYFAKKK